MDEETFTNALRVSKYTDKQELEVTVLGRNDPVRGKLLAVEGGLAVMQIRSKGVVCIALGRVSMIEIAD